MATVSRWFDKKRGLAAGIASSGVGLGPLIIAPFATYILLNYSWRTSFIVVGLVAWLVVLPISRLLRGTPREIVTLPDDAKEAPEDITNGFLLPTGLSLREAIRTRSYWVITLIYLSFSSSSFFIMAHIVPHVTDVGFSAMEAAAILGIIGGAAIAGRVLMGIVSDRVGRKFALFICALLLGAAVLWLIWADAFWMLQLFALLFGFAFGGMGSTLAALISDTFGVGRIGTILGVLEACFGLGGAIGPAAGGFIFDVNNSYIMAFLLGAIEMFTAALIVFLIRREYG
jgi:MFS family permease